MQDKKIGPHNNSWQHDSSLKFATTEANQQVAELRNDSVRNRVFRVRIHFTLVDDPKDSRRACD